MRRRLLLTIVLVVIMSCAIVAAALTLRVALAAGPIAIREAGSLFLLGISFLVLASVARRAFAS
jgi:hypothetical protein